MVTVTSGTPGGLNRSTRSTDTISPRRQERQVPVAGVGRFDMMTSRRGAEWSSTKSWSDLPIGRWQKPPYLLPFVERTTATRSGRRMRSSLPCLPRTPTPGGTRQQRRAAPPFSLRCWWVLRHDCMKSWWQCQSRGAFRALRRVLEAPVTASLLRRSPSQLLLPYSRCCECCQCCFESWQLPLPADESLGTMVAMTTSLLAP